MPRKAAAPQIYGPYTVTQGFNEAAAVVPRKAPVLATDTIANIAGFNEAAAVVPRKASMGGQSWVLRACAGFNEAAAVVPRKASPNGGGISDAERASMRPRQ